MLVMNGTWRKPGVYNMEEFDPDPFMDALNKWGAALEDQRESGTGGLKREERAKRRTENPLLCNTGREIKRESADIKRSPRADRMQNPAGPEGIFPCTASIR